MSDADDYESECFDAADEYARSQNARPIVRRHGKGDKKSFIEQFRLKDETTKKTTSRLRQISRININALIGNRDVSAKKIGVDSKWLARLRKHGLSYGSKLNEESLKAIASYFRLSDSMQLWDPTLIKQMGLLSDTKKGFQKNRLERIERSRFVKQASRLVELLDTGDFDHVALLIDDLYDLMLKKSSIQSSDADPDGVESADGDCGAIGKWRNSGNAASAPVEAEG